MAWNDGSRFLIASGVKWGNGPKIYKGSSKDTTWNKDLLWKMYVEKEAMKTGVHLPKNAADVDAMPPFMKPLAAAIKSRGREPIPFKDPFQHDPQKTCQVHTDRSSPLRRLRKLINFPDLAAEEGPPRRREKTPSGSARRRHAAAAAADLSRSSSSASVALASARSRRSASAASARPGTTSARLKAIEDALHQERAERQSLAQSLAQERRQREAVEAELRKLRGDMESGGASAEKLKQYEKIMAGLMQTVKRAEERKLTARSRRSQRSQRMQL